MRPAGVLSWTPTEAQGPGDYPVTVRATDPDGLHADRSFTIHVTEVNIDPSLAAIADQTVNPGDVVGLHCLGQRPGPAGQRPGLLPRLRPDRSDRQSHVRSLCLDGQQHPLATIR